MKCIDDYQDHLFFTDEMYCYYETEGPFDFMQTITKLKSAGCSVDSIQHFRKAFVKKQDMLLNNRTGLSNTIICNMKFIPYSDELFVNFIDSGWNMIKNELK